MPDLDPRLQRAIIAALIAVLSAFGITVAFTTGPGQTTVTITVKGSDGPTAVVKTTTDALDAVERSAVGEHSDARDETPTGLTGAQVAGARAQQNRLAERDQLPLTQPDAAPEQRGCRSNFVRSYSTRGGVKPRLIFEHYTVSGNLPGFRDINALTAYANNSSNGVSWHYNFDRDGNCAYTVREADKAWTQATMNRVGIGIEIVNRGRGDGPLFTANGLKRHARVVSDIARRWDIPVRRGKVNRSTCTVTRSGIVDHNDAGVCGGNHFDITPYDVDHIIAAVRAYRRAASATTRRCNELATIRRDIRRHRSTPAQRDRARTLKGVLGAKATSCR